MFLHTKIQNLDDFFKTKSERRGDLVYFYRINGYTEEIGRFIRSYYEQARKAGVIIEGKLPNPDEKNLSYYQEIMGMDFQLDAGFINASLKKWLPRMNDCQRKNVADSIYDSLSSMHGAGKTEHMLKNAYIKFMCWLYYKFERIVNQLGGETIPKILYEGSITNYELMLISILSNAGCDVVLLQVQGDEAYRKLDALSALSDEFRPAGLQPFPDSFSLKQVREQIQEEMNQARLYGRMPSRVSCTNAWIGTGGTGVQTAPGSGETGTMGTGLSHGVFYPMQESPDGTRAGLSRGIQNPMQESPDETGTDMKILSEFLKSSSARGSDSRFFYNSFIRINGVLDKLTYANELYQFHLKLKNTGRRLVIVNERIERPSMDEITAIHRSSYAKLDQLVLDLQSNIKYTASIELQRMMVKAFVDVILAESKKAGSSLNKLTNKAVYLLSWLRRYQEGLFSGWKEPETGCFIYMGGCRDENEALFLRMLARMPVDVLILCPNLEQKCCLTDSTLYEIHYSESLAMRTFPQENADVHIGTAAYHAERELDDLMYRDSGIYRSNQYEKANALILQTMYEEIKILWNEEVKYRPNFGTMGDVVNIPVIFAKVSGVKDADVSGYWRSVRELVNEDTFVIKKAPLIEPASANPMKAYAPEFLKNGRLMKAKIKSHPSYPYGFLREEMQDYILDKLQALIDQKLIRGTFENGTEYAIVAAVLNLPKELVRLIQKFDFTKKNPKCVYIHTTEEMISLEDTILMAFLNLAGFDVVFFVPTGYQNVEKYFNRKIMDEHQIGEYVYDLRVPNLEGFSGGTRQRWRDRIFKRR